MRNTWTGLLIAVAVTLAAPACAQDIHTPPQFSDSDAKGAIINALQMMPQVNCGASACAPATPEEFAAPPVQVEDARFALRTGAKSALLAWCGLDWQTRTHAYMMRAFAQKYPTNMRAIAVLRMIHAVQQGRDYTNLQVLRTCTPRMRAELDEQNPSVVQTVSQQMIDQVLRDESIAKMLQLVLERMPEALCGPKTKCAPATSDEKAHPPVSVDEARLAMTAGLMSGTAEHCGLDWKRQVYAPMMAHHRVKLKKSDRQLAILGVLHSTMQAYMLTGYRQRGETCTAELRADLQHRLSTPAAKPAASPTPKDKARR